MAQQNDLSYFKEQQFYASGKLLLFGEYLVLRNTKSLAVPLSYGQKLTLYHNFSNEIKWESFYRNNCWLSIRFFDDFEISETNDIEKAKIIQNLFRVIKKQNPDLNISGLHFKFELDFDRNFGWGTSSTLISILSQWSNVNPYILLEKSFKGSGYDIAAATAGKPFIYTIKNKIESLYKLPESITKYLLFVYLGEKQDSRKAVADFSNKSISKNLIDKMNEIVEKAVAFTKIEEWEKLMKESEEMLSDILKIKTVKAEFFNDYPYQIKSLGAWGGDFIMATCRNVETAKNYFEIKSKHIVFTYEELIKN